ncbi:MAG: hypothetical protein Q4D57_03025, partial [Clostridia bacterium]|nr:hypothetical protein [Clostridia bacterium]
FKLLFGIGVVVALISSVLLFLGGCGKKLVTSTYTDEENKVSISLSYPEDNKFIYSTDSKDFRTSAEDAVLTSDTYKIAWDVVSAGYSGDFEKVKEKAMDREESKEATYNGVKGVSYYYSPYVRYTVALPINEKCYIEFHVYSTNEKHDKEHADEVFNKDEVQNILKTVAIKQL